MRYESDDIPDLSEIGGHWGAREPEYHHHNRIAPGRRIARLPGRQWPFIPEECEAGLFDTEWILDGRVLLCLGCGIDGT